VVQKILVRKRPETINCRMQWTIKKIQLDLKYTWKISRNASNFKENFIVTCSNNKQVGIGEVAPNIRYQETPEGIFSSFQSIERELRDCPLEPMQFEIWLKKLAIPKALKFGIESAFVHWHCKSTNIALHDFLGIQKPDKVATCYTLPIMDASDIPAFYQNHQLHRFKHLKVKVNDVEALEMIKVLNRLGDHPIMIDANEAWKDVDALIQFIATLKQYPIVFVEQPLPSDYVDEYIYLKQHSVLPIMGDESVLDNPNFDMLEKQFHGINMKLMKAGGYLNGIRILKEAKARNLTTMIGCMVETTLGIKSAWNLGSLVDYADLDGCLIVENEPFHLIKEEDGYFYEVN